MARATCGSGGRNIMLLAHISLNQKTEGDWARNKTGL